MKPTASSALEARRPPQRLAMSVGQSSLLLAVVVLAGIGATAWFSRQARQLEDERIRESFRSLTRYQVAANHERVRLINELLQGLQRAITYQNALERDEFEGICAEILAGFRGFQSLQWVQVVTRDERADVERQMHADYGFPISFKSRTATGAFEVSEEKDTYRVIRYAMPFETNAIVLGYDVLTSPTFSTQERAATTRELAVSAPFRLAQSTAEDEELGVIFILPVHDHRRAGAPLLGFVQGVFRISGIFEPSVLPENREHAVYRYFDQTDNAQQPVLFLSTERERRGRPSSQQPVAAGSITPYVDEDVMHVGGREWRFVAQARPVWIRSLRDHTSELVLGGGLALTILAVTMLLGYLRRSRWVEQLVEERTHELLTQQGELQAILDHSPNAIWIKDLNGRYMIANRKIAQIYGQPIERILGSTDDLFYPQKVAAEMRAEDLRTLRANSDIMIEGEYEILGEKRHYYTVKFPVRRESGEVFGIGGIATDVTDFKRVETQLAETQKLESLGVLAGGIAHDFNNLLTGMLGNASLIAHMLPAEDEIGQSAREIETAARRAAELCRQMLAYSGRGKFVMERLDLSAAVEELVPLLRSSIGPRVEWKLTLARELPAVDVDPAQLRQVIMNLVINAAEAQPAEGGYVEVSTSQRKLDSAALSEAVGQPDLPEGIYVSFKVLDRGHGIAAETMRRIFEPFFTTKFTGRGLGLSAVLGIVRSHQGALLVDSEVGRGSTFELLLPSAEGGISSRESDAPTTAALPPMNGLRIFLVEDEPTVYRLVNRVLTQAGAHVTAYHDGARAVAEFDPHRFDLAVIDLTLPGLGGGEVFHRLRAVQPTLPVLLVSGYSEQEAANHFSTTRPNSFLQKPFSSHELLQTIDDIRQRSA